MIVSSKKAQQYLRVRPAVENDEHNVIKSIVHDETAIPPPYTKILEENLSTSQVYETTCCKKIVFNAAAFGVSGAILAHGQRSSGKTHLMIGSKDSPGILHLASVDLMKQANHLPNGVNISMSILAVCNNLVFDLCNAGKQAKVQGLNVNATRVKIESTHIDEITSFARKWIFNDIVHIIIRFHIPILDLHKLDKENKATAGGITSSREAILALVDLAGTEQVRRPGSTGRIPKERASAVKSLNSLMQVVNALGTPNIPNSRRCRLTQVLKSCLSGNANVALLHCVTPSQLHDLRVHEANKRNVHKVEVEQAETVLQDKAAGLEVPVETRRRSLRIAGMVKKQKEDSEAVGSDKTYRPGLEDIGESPPNTQVETRRRSARIAGLADKKQVHNLEKIVSEKELVGVLKPCKYGADSVDESTETTKRVTWDDTLERFQLIPRVPKRRNRYLW